MDPLGVGWLNISRLNIFATVSIRDGSRVADLVSTSIVRAGDGVPVAGGGPVGCLGWVDRLIGWLVDRLVDRLVRWIVDPIWLVDCIDRLCGCRW